MKSFDICKAYSLSKIPKELFDCTEISYMRMFMSGIDEIPKEFPVGILQLENLEHLNLFGNDIRKIPKEIGNFKKLESINT